MKKVLFVLGSFFPEPSANAICCMEIMQQLLSEGCEVHCVSNRFPDMSSYEEIRGVRVHRVYVPLNYYVQKQLTKSRTAVKKHLLRFALKIVNAYHLIVSAVNFPFFTMCFSRSLCRKTIAVINENSIDTVVCVNQPMAALYVGCKLKQTMTSVRWIAYLLDPIRNGLRHPLLSSGRSDSKLLSLQNKVMTEFDLVVAQNEHRKLFECVLAPPQAEKLCFLGAPLLTEKSVPPVKLQSGKKAVIYAGGLSGTRSPAFVAEAFRYVQSATLHIYSANQSRWLKDILGDNPNVVLHPAIDRAQLMSIMKGADGLLSIGNTQSEYAPSKIIECISFGKPLITTYRTDEDTCQPYMDKYPKGVYLDERAMTPEEAALSIDSLLSQSEDEILFAELEKCYWDNTPSAFIDVVKRYC